jgi:hypothetical protein
LKDYHNLNNFASIPQSFTEQWLTKKYFFMTIAMAEQGGIGNLYTKKSIY